MKFLLTKNSALIMLELDLLNMIKIKILYSNLYNPCISNAGDKD